MNVSKYLENMKNLPDRFSNLAFWRGVRKLRDKIVDTFEYVGEWGNGIENSLSSIDTDLSGLKEWKTTVDSSLSRIDADLSGLKEWKTTVDSTLSSIDNDLSGLQNWKTSVDNSLSSIENLLRNFNRSFGHDYFPRSVVELSSDEMKKISIVTVESSDSNGAFSTGYIKVASGDLHIKEISGYDNTISMGRCGARLEVELSDHTHTMIPLGVYVEHYKYWNDPREFTFKLHFYCNDSYDSYFPVNPRLSVSYAKIIFDGDALQLSVAI